MDDENNAGRPNPFLSPASRRLPGLLPKSMIPGIRSTGEEIYGIYNGTDTDIYIFIYITIKSRFVFFIFPVPVPQMSNWW